MNISTPYYIEPRQADAHLSLDGSWDFGYMAEPCEPQDVDYTMKAAVPGTVYWQLYEAGKMPNPYEGTNCKQFGWVDDVVWYYHRTFSLDRDAAQRTVLCMDGSCYFTRVWLNGQLLGDHAGMFGGPYVQVGDLINYHGENEIVLEVRAANYRNPKFDPRNGDLSIPHVIVPWNLVRENGALDGDFNVIGPWRSVRLEFLNGTHLSRPYLYTRSADTENAQLSFEVEITDPDMDELKCALCDTRIGGDYMKFTNSFSGGNRGVRQDRKLSVLLELTERSTGHKVYSVSEDYSPFDWSQSGAKACYNECHHYRRMISLPHPRLWYPAAMGSPEMYDVHVALYEGDQLLDEQSFGTGIRTITRTDNAGDKFRTRWDKFQFVINGEKRFITGVNWMPIDHFLILRPEEYRWSLELARNMGVMLIRVWSGGGIPESDVFYELCDEMGIMVWQDSLIANCDTANWDHDQLLDEVCLYLYRIRNHPSLAIHCGGNEFNPYSKGNLAALCVIENAIQDLDPAREWVRTTPDRGSAHIYNDMEPMWYRLMYKQLPFVAESGIHSFPSMKAWHEVVSAEEIGRPLTNVFSEEFSKNNPEVRCHFVEYVPQRIPRMLSRASMIADIDGIDLEGLTEATQVASYEFYQVMIDSLRENYPVTTGVMPWVFRRPSVAVGIQLVDGRGNPIAPYYAVRNAYRSLNVSLMLGNMTWAAGETVPLDVWLHNGLDETIPYLYLKAEVLDPSLNVVLSEERCVSVQEGVSGKRIQMGGFVIPDEYEDRYFFVRLSLQDEHGTVCRKLYWPRCLGCMRDESFRAERRAAPVPNMMMEHGPWLKPQISGTKTQLEVALKVCSLSDNRQEAVLSITNAGDKPAFPVVAESVTLPCYADDSYFMLMPEETRLVHITMFRRDGRKEKKLRVSAWNTPEYRISLE